MFHDIYAQCLLISVEQTINHRVKILVQLKSEGNVRAFGRLADVNYQTTHNIIEKSNNPGYEYIQKILSKFQDISPDWFLLGNGEMFRSQTAGNSRDQMEIEALKTRVETLELLNESLTDKISEYKLTVENLKSLLALNTANNKQQLMKEKKKSK